MEENTEKGREAVRMPSPIVRPSGGADPAPLLFSVFSRLCSVPSVVPIFLIFF